MCLDGARAAPVFSSVQLEESAYPHISAPAALCHAMGPAGKLDEEALLRKDVEENYRASLKLSRSRPTRFTPRLRERLYASNALFCMGQFLESSQDQEFLSTVAVLCCVVVFAWTKKGPHCPKGFGAHVCLQNAMGVCFYRNPSKHALHELVLALRTCFAEVSPSEVEVHIVGGHEWADRNNNTLNVDSIGKKSHLSGLVIDAVKTAGFKNINQTMLNPFPGGPLGPSPMCEYRLIKDNQRIAVAALHMETGRIVTHSDAASAEDEVPRDWWAASDRATWSIAVHGQPLAHASVKTHVLFVSYMILTAAILWWSTSLTWALGVLGALWILKPVAVSHLCSRVMVATILYKCLVAVWT